uniref:Uncharacterized protein n=1 Tax=Caulobacter sp. (strain K31) TaxID=366602 RepID=B0SX07_CAUSK
MASSFAWPAWAGDVLAPPHWSSDQVRAARPLAPETALVFDVRVEETGGPRGSQVQSATVALAPTFTQIVEGGAHTLHDHALCRVFTWSDDKPIFQSVSCYALPAFLGMELENRRYLARVLAAAEGVKAAADPYWPEAELGVQDEAKDRLQRRDVPSGAEYRLDNEVVVKVTGVMTPLSAAESRSLARYFAHQQPLHPQVRRDLKSGSVLPARLEIQSRMGRGDVRKIVTITNPRRVQMSPPLPPGLTSDLYERARAETVFGRGVRQALAGIDGKAKPEKPSFDALLASMKDASSQGRSSEVMLLFFAMTQQYGGEFSGPRGQTVRTQVIPIFAKARADATAGMLWNASDLAGDAGKPGDREAVARSLATATDLDRMMFGTFRYVTYANLFRMTPQADKWDPAIRKAMPQDLVDNYWMHIAAYPWAGNVYKDAGDTYYAAYDPVNAWLAFDLGRAIDPDWRAGVLSGLAAYEDKLRLAEPDFF